MMKRHIFVFPNAVNRRHSDESIQLDIHGSELHFFHNNEKIIVDTALLENGSSTVIVSNGMTDTTYALYNFREILQALDMMPSEFFATLSQRCFFQIDKSGDELFMKVFLLKGMNELPSKTDDFSTCSHHTLDYIHELDWKYSWTIKNVEGKVRDGYLTLVFETVLSDFWKTPVYISHGGQVRLCHDGKNVVKFRYNPTENAYLGSRNCRYKGRAIDLERLLGGMSDGL